MNNDFVLEIYRNPKTVFSFKDISLILQEDDMKSSKARVHYYVTKGVLRAVRKGVYVKPDYDQYELAANIYTPSYISLETVLEREGIIFQHYGSIFAISYLSREIKVDGKNIVFRKIKNEILFNNEGVKQKGNYPLATKERAFLDAVYLYKDYHFDNIEGLNRNEVYRLADMYQCKTLVRKIKEILK